MKIQHHRIDTNVVVGLLVREFRCSRSDVSAKVLAMYAGNRTPPMEPQWLAAGLSQTMGDQVELTKNRSFFAYEKDGVLYEFQPSRVWEYDLKIAAEYALKRNADRVYCYQALTAWNPVDENMVVGYEVALQRLPIRIPYDDLLIQNDGNGYLVMPVNNSGTINLLDYGNVRNQSTATWIKVGGAAHFGNEEGSDSVAIGDRASGPKGPR